MARIPYERIGLTSRNRNARDCFSPRMPSESRELMRRYGFTKTATQSKSVTLRGMRVIVGEQEIVYTRRRV